MNWCENKREISLSFLLPCSCAPNRERAFHKCVWYTWVNTFPMLIFCTAVHLSPTESRNSKLLTRWLQMPDRAPSLIGLHGASISLIGQNYGISERGEMTEECWNWKKMKSCVAHTSLCADWHVCRGGGGRWSEHLSGENKTSSVELWFWVLLGFCLLAFFLSWQQQIHFMQ